MSFFMHLVSFSSFVLLYQKWYLPNRGHLFASSKEGDLVLDPFLGSGTTCAVAKKLHRKSVGIEKETSYVKIAAKRLTAIELNLFENLEPTELEQVVY